MHRTILISSILIVSIIALVLALTLVETSSNILTLKNKAEPLTEMESRILAEDYIVSSPTYSYDGKNLTFMRSEPLKCPACWTHSYFFYSDYLGYGNPREDPYRYYTSNVVEITMNDKEVVSMTINYVWDELEQDYK